MGNTSRPAVITEVGWYVENIDATFWTSYSGSAHLFYDFWIGYSGSFNASDVESARVYLPGMQTWWTIDPATYLDNGNKFVGGFERFWYSSNNNALPIGTLTAEIKFKNGTSTSYEFTTNQPGSLGTGGHAVTTSEDSSVSYGGTNVSALKRPTGLSATKSVAGNTVTINFTLADSRSYNGFVWLYDSGKNFIGSFTYLFNKTTGAQYSGLNGGGGGLNTSGANTLTISGADISFSSGYTLSNIAGFEIVVVDGSQYASRGSGHYADYDYRAISAHTNVN